MEQRERDVCTRIRDTATERVAKLFAIAPEDLCPEYSPPDYSPPRDVLVEERLYYDRAKRR
jgi:hypothetical protein